MKKIFLLNLLVGFFTAILTLKVSAYEEEICVEPSLNMSTFNVLRFDAKHAKEFLPWSMRGPGIAAWAENHNIDLLGVQEALKPVIDDLNAWWPEALQFGNGRFDNFDRGEFAAIYKFQSKLQVLENGQFWLSKTPDLPGSIGWDAFLPRIVTWVKLRTVCRNEFFLFNTHFPLREKSKRKSLLVFEKKIREIAGESPFVLMGDFNLIHKKLFFRQFQMRLGVEDAMFLTKTPHRGPRTTFKYRYKVDHILVPSKNFEVLEHSIDEPKITRDQYLSDHLPIRAKIRLLLPSGERE